MSVPSVLVVFGTRPEAIKLAPVILELNGGNRRLHPIVYHTGQHSTMADSVLDWFNIRPEIRLQVMQPDQDLSSLTARLLEQLSATLVQHSPDAVLVQGDTATAMAASMAAFYKAIPVAHVEAGLRTGDLQRPFPEEFNRRVIALASTLHFAPTAAGAEALRREGVAADRIFVVGNTVVDGLRITRDRLSQRDRVFSDRLTRVLITAHRRESFGSPFEEICQAIRTVADRNKNIQFIFPVHLNPNVRNPVSRWLSGHEQIELTEPARYEHFIKLMLDSDLILTDSGGVQEEAAVLGKPTLILRQTTERPEVVSLGNGRLVGSRKEDIVAEVETLLNDRAAYESMSVPSTAFGDGYAAGRIVGELVNYLTRRK